MQDFDIPKLLRAATNIIFLVVFISMISNIAAIFLDLRSLYPAALKVPGYRYASTVEAYKKKCGASGILLFGPSTVREGIDSRIVEDEVGVCAFNLGITSSGSIFHMELLSDINGNMKVKSEVVVLGLNSRMLAARENPFMENGYIDFLNFSQAFYYSDVDGLKNIIAGRMALAHRMFPILKSRKLLGIIVKEALTKNKVTLEEVEGRRFIYSDKSFNNTAFEKQLKGTKDLGLLDPDKYASQEQILSMKRTIRKAYEYSNKVIIVVMPEHSEVRNGFGSIADSHFHEVLDEFSQEGVIVVDASTLILDSEFRDMAHLLEPGRVKLSNKIAESINRGVRNAL